MADVKAWRCCCGGNCRFVIGSFFYGNGEMKALREEILSEVMGVPRGDDYSVWVV